MPVNVVPKPAKDTNSECPEAPALVLSAEAQAALKQIARALGRTAAREFIAGKASQNDSGIAGPPAVALDIACSSDVTNSSQGKCAEEQERAATQNSTPKTKSVKGKQRVAT